MAATSGDLAAWCAGDAGWPSPLPAAGSGHESRQIRVVLVVVPARPGDPTHQCVADVVTRRGGTDAGLVITDH